MTTTSSSGVVVLSAAEARALVTPTGWLRLQALYSVYSRDQRLLVSKAGYLYTARPCSPHW